MTIPIPQCCGCKHFNIKKATCPAFDRIPAEIVFNEFDHHKPYKGDHGIQFSPKKAKK